MATAREEHYAANYVAPGKGVTTRPRRHRRAVERLVGEVQSKVEALSSSQVRKLAPLLGRAQKELEDGLAKWLAEAPEAGDRFTAHQMRSVLRQIRGARDALVEINPKLGELLTTGNEEMAGLSTATLQHEVSRLAQVFGGEDFGFIGTDLDTATRLVEKNDWLIPRFERSAARYGQKAFGQIRNRLGVAVLKNETVGQTIKRIAGIIPGQKLTPDVASKMADGFMTGSAYWAERVIRTELANAYATHHLTSMEEMSGSDALLGQTLPEAVGREQRSALLSVRRS